MRHRLLIAVASVRALSPLKKSLPSGGTVTRRGRAAARAAEGDYLSTLSGGGAADALDGLDKEFLAIALPAVVQFAAEPVARLVDTAYRGGAEISARRSPSRPIFAASGDLCSSVGPRVS